MRKILLPVVIGLFFTTFIFGQQKQHKIVFDFTKADTASVFILIRHVTNIMDMTRNGQIEVVCHGAGLDILVKDKTTVQKEIEELQMKYKVIFSACEVTMKRRGVDKSQLLAKSTTVPAAVLEMSSKQLEGWSYIKE